MDADPEGEATFLGGFLIGRSNPFLDADRTLDRINDAWELSENTVACGVGRATAVLGDVPIHNLAARVEQGQSSGLIHIHQAHVSRHVSVEDCCEAALYD